MSDFADIKGLRIDTLWVYPERLAPNIVFERDGDDGGVFSITHSEAVQLRDWMDDWLPTITMPKPTDTARGVE